MAEVTKTARELTKNTVHADPIEAKKITISDSDDDDDDDLVGPAIPDSKLEILRMYAFLIFYLYRLWEEIYNYREK